MYFLHFTVSWFDKGEGRVGCGRGVCSRKNRGSKREVEQCKWKACFREKKKKEKMFAWCPKSQKESILAAKNRDYTEAQAQLCPVRDASKGVGGGVRRRPVSGCEGEWKWQRLLERWQKPEGSGIRACDSSWKSNPAEKKEDDSPVKEARRRGG